jgi:hypothetical protein
MSCTVPSDTSKSAAILRKETGGFSARIAGTMRRAWLVARSPAMRR